MGTIRPFLRNVSFNPEAIKAMSAAFENAKRKIPEQTLEAHEALAMRIITFASRGELDAEKLSTSAVESYAAWRKTG